MSAHLDPCPSYEKRTTQTKGTRWLKCDLWDTLLLRRLDTGYVILHCLASLVGSRGREDGRKPSSDSLPEETGKPVQDGFHPLCYRRITRCISKTQISCTSSQPLPTWLIWMPTRRSRDKAELFPYSSSACGLKPSYCRKLKGKLLNLLPQPPTRMMNHKQLSHAQGRMAEMSASLEDLRADSPHHIPVLAPAKTRTIWEVGSWLLQIQPSRSFSCSCIFIKAD